MLEWKMHLAMKTKFMSSTDSNKKRTMYCKSDSSVIMIGNGSNETTQELPDSFLHVSKRLATLFLILFQECIIFAIR